MCLFWSTNVDSIKDLEESRMALRIAINIIPEAAKLNGRSRNKWGFVDGKIFRVEKPADANIHNSMYNGWLHQTLITGTICFGADSTIVWAKHNCPGSWNDGDTVVHSKTHFRIYVFVRIPTWVY
ncbi:hypothetical protein ROZALSC1DRAFT_24353 [Rozella allomycis CSF55]|uniref:DDE Tnp4 domain-containing protein n=1 Tax=Rozella allomycis (strain CSF55) TaxID=988480 RepID=A0A4P9YG50_ROZAC|nr:hypothetical protein ROZALSC1DRAFT_24353 [Rozella allomycis CSF55]